MIRSSRFPAGCALAFLLAFSSSSALADVKLPGIFGDHMVLQQDKVAPVWGMADPGEAVTVTLGNLKAQTTAGADGTWSVGLELKASDSPTTLTVTGKNTITIKDVLLGEVWVCSGQSNMQFALQSAHNAATALPAANDPQMRLFVVPMKVAHTPQSDSGGYWQLCTPKTAAPFTAVGYFFGKELRSALNRPVGLIESNWGGTPAQAWTSLDGLKQDPELAHYVEQWNGIDKNLPAEEAKFPAAEAAYQAATKDWNEKYGKAYQGAVSKWNADSQTAKAAGQPLPPKPVPPKPMPVKPVPPTGNQNSPANLFNAMIAPLQPYAIRGVIWYQGESNAHKGEDTEYRTLFGRMIKDWRRGWREGDFPFLYVQLAGYGTDDQSWPALRESQKETLSLPNTGMATAVDIGLKNNIHPMDKEDVGKRLALVALHTAYGKDVVYSGPMYKSAAREGNAVRVSFDDIGSGLEIGKAPWVGPGITPLPDDHLVGFEVAGTDGNWQPADAKIDGATVLVSSANVSAPDSVRYDWKGAPEGNLYNKEGLPAPPFEGKVE